MIPGAFGSVSRPLNERSQERQAHPLVVGCSTETGSDAGKVFLRASSSASSWRLRLSLSPSSGCGLRFGVSVSLTALLKMFRDMAQISVRSSSSGTPFASSGCRKRSHGDTSIGSFSYHGRGWKLLHQQRRRSFHHGDAVPHRPLHLLEGTHAYLAHALARDAELVGKLAERDRFFGEPTRLEDASLPVVERG